jgi:hypothetical protein
MYIHEGVGLANVFQQLGVVKNVDGGLVVEQDSSRGHSPASRCLRILHCGRLKDCFSAVMGKKLEAGGQIVLELTLGDSRQ